MKLSHFDESRQLPTRDVGAKPAMLRVPQARARAILQTDVVAALHTAGHATTKGAIPTTSHIAGAMGAKAAAQPVPMPSRALAVADIEAHDALQGRVLLVCSAGRRSGHSARGLRAKGLRNVHSLAGVTP